MKWKKWMMEDDSCTIYDEGREINFNDIMSAIQGVNENRVIKAI